MPTDALINVNGDSVQTLEILFLTTILMLLPSLIIMMTSFTRYVVVFSFLRNAMGTQQTPPNMVLIGMALILTLFTMSPTLAAINEEAFEPYQAEEITQEEFIDRALVPMKEFMLQNTKPETLRMYCNLAHHDIPEDNAGLDQVVIRRTKETFEVIPVSAWVDEDDLLAPRAPEMDLR